MLFLSNTVARRRALPKLTDSESMFLAMQYFAMDGNMDEAGGNPADSADMSAALAFRYLSPAGLADHSMKTVLRFRNANVDGRSAFRRAVNTLVGELSKVEDQDQARDVVLSFNPITLLLYIGLPVCVNAFETGLKSSDGTWNVAAIGFAAVWGLADVLISKRSKWIPEEASYFAKLRDSFVEEGRFPPHVPRFGRMMDEFLND